MRMSNLDPSDILASDARPQIAIAEGLRNGWFEIWYQPKIDLRRKCLVGAEALTWLCRPEVGEQPAQDCVAADDASAAELAEHALMTVLSDWSAFESAGFNLHLALNVPATILQDVAIVELTREYRPRSERWPGLILEVTEDQIVRNIKLAKELASTLRASGVTIAIDEFGAGYSSFSSLRELPFAELKLARGFVKDTATEATNAAICQTAIDLAHRFGSLAVAEGIESAADMQALAVMGCDFGQGALIAPPMPKARFLDLLQQRNAPAKPIGRVA